MRIIIDTNLWISFIISKKFNQIELFIIENNTILLFNEDLILKIESTMSKPKLKKYFGKNALNEMLNAFEDCIEFVATYSSVKLCRDEKDNFLLNLAIDGNADYLITGDKDLLILDQIKNTKIRTITDFTKTITNLK